MPDFIDNAANPNGTAPNNDPIVREDFSQQPASVHGDPIVKGDAPGRQEDTFTSVKPDALTQEEQNAYKNMQRDYTRKTQQLAEMRREYEEKMALLNAVGQQRQTPHDQPQPQMSKQQEGVLRGILRDQWDSMDQEARNVWGTLDRAFDVFKEQLLSQIPQQNQMDPRVIQALGSEVIALKAQQGIQSLKATYGAETIGPLEQQIIQTCQAYPGVTPEQALSYIDPNIQQEYWMRQGMRQAEQQLKRQRASASSNGSPFPSVDINDEFVVGEPMAKTAARAAQRMGGNTDQIYHELYGGD